MASVGKDSKGYRVRFVMPDGTNKTIRLAGFNKSKSEDIARHIEELKPVVELGAFLAEYRDDGLKGTGERAAALTVVKWRAPMDSLLRFFEYERDISTITHEDAHQYRKWMDERRIKKTKTNPKGQPLAENTKRKHMDNAKVFFNGAKRRGLIPVNPFEHQVSSTRPNRERDYFVKREETEKLIEVCPDAEWRLLVSLWRYSGLRKMEVFHAKDGSLSIDLGRRPMDSGPNASSCDQDRAP